VSLDGTVVITGGSGFVGKHLVKELRLNWPDARLVVWDKSIADLPDGVEGVGVDIAEPDSYRQSLMELRPQWIVHLAAVASVGSAMNDPELTMKVNVEATERLLGAARDAMETKVLAVSSADIYGRESSIPLPELELDEAEPGNPYAESKLEMERMIKGQFNDMVVRVRPFPHIGPGQGLGFVTADFASQVAAVEARKQEPVIKVGSLDKARDFTDVRDIVRAYRLLMEKGRVGEVYHVASEKATQVSEILNRLINMATVEVEVVKDEERVRPVDISVLVGSAAKIREETGWRPEISLDRSLTDILAYWRKVTNNGLRGHK